MHVRASARRLPAHLAGLLLALMAAGTVLAPPAVAGSPPATVRALGIRTATVAAGYAGTPYRWGGTTPRGFDCSGYTQYVYARVGIKIPRTAQAQFSGARKVGRHVLPGDLVFFFRPGTRTVYHVGIYAGNDRVWHSPRTGSEVRREKIWTSGWAGGRY